MFWIALSIKSRDLRFYIVLIVDHIFSPTEITKLGISSILLYLRYENIVWINIRMNNI
jgi:hypothetical protein